MLVEFLSGWYILLMLLFLFAQNVTYCFIINQGHIFLCPPRPKTPVRQTLMSWPSSIIATTPLYIMHLFLVYDSSKYRKKQGKCSFLSSKSLLYEVVKNDLENKGARKTKLPFSTIILYFVSLQASRFPSPCSPPQLSCFYISHQKTVSSYH